MTERMPEEEFYKFVDDFTEAAVSNDTDAMAELAANVADRPVEVRVKLLEKIIGKLEKLDDVSEIKDGLKATVNIMKMAQDYAETVAQDSTVEEAKDDTKAEEVTQDVAADNSAEAVEAEDGDAPTVEEKAEKTEQ